MKKKKKKSGTHEDMRMRNSQRQNSQSMLTVLLFLPKGVFQCFPLFLWHNGSAQIELKKQPNEQAYSVGHAHAQGLNPNTDTNIWSTRAKHLQSSLNYKPCRLAY